MPVQQSLAYDPARVDTISGDGASDNLLSFSKVTPPTLHRVHPNARLFARLDTALAKPVVWIHGPPGAGKTTLAASYLAARGIDPLWYRLDAGDADPATLFLYLAAARRPGGRAVPTLTPEYRGALPLFARRFFGGLLSCPRTSMLVFDDYHEVSPDAAAHECFAAGLEEVPDGRRVVVVSRAPPPPQLARLRVNGLIEVVEPEALRVTVAEAEGLARERGAEADGAGVERITRRTQGWAAGVILMLEAGTQSLPDAPTEAPVPEVLFDYFAGEVLRRFEPRVQRLLHALALMPTMTATVAVQLTGEPDAGDVLEDLRRRNYFTTRDAGAEPRYRFHPLFREFLLGGAHERLSADELDALRLRASAALDDDDQPDEAAPLLVQASAWDELSALVKRRARALLAQGRHDTLVDWLAKLPADLTARDPWLSHWAGAAVLPFDPIKARPRFSRALALFEAAGDVDGMFLSWAGVALALHGDLFVDGTSYDELVRAMRALLARHPLPTRLDLALPVALGMYIALCRRGGQPDEVAAWRERVLAAARECPEPGQFESVCFVVVQFDVVGGEFASARALLDRLPHPRNLNDHPLAQHRGYLALSIAQIWGQAPGECVATVREALEHSRRYGFQVRDHVFACQAACDACLRGDLKAAGDWLGVAARNPDRHFPGGGVFYSLTAAQHALLHGRHDEATRQAEAAVTLGERQNWRLHEVRARLTLAETRIERGDLREAAAELDRVDAVLALGGAHALDINADFLRADLRLADGDEAAGLAALAKALATGRKRGDRRVGLLPRRLSQLCALALRSGIEPDFVKGLIHASELPPPDGADETWPWPVRIKTFGGLKVEVDGEPLAFARKTPKRLVALLKAIVAYGGTDVPEEKLVDVVWPDEDGDAGHRALTVALHRLRKLLGDAGAVAVKGGRVGLDPSRCWLDLWSFERALARRGPAEPAEAYLKRVEQGLSLHGDGFLPDDDAWWLSEARDRMREACARGRRAAAVA